MTVWAIAIVIVGIEVLVGLKIVLDYLSEHDKRGKK